MGDIDNGPETWLDDHGDYLLQFAYVRLRNRAAAEDALQETFLAAMKAFERYDGKTPVRYWLRGILRHKVVDYIRKASREVAVDDTRILKFSIVFDSKHSVSMIKTHPTGNSIRKTRLKEKNSCRFFMIVSQTSTKIWAKHLPSVN